MPFQRPGPMTIVRFGLVLRIWRIASAKIGLIVSVVAASLGSLSSSNATPVGALGVMLGDLPPDGVGTWARRPRGRW